MNRQDFQRNFQYSYFGVLLTSEVVKRLSLLSAVKDAAMPLGSVMPVTRPGVMGDETRMKALAILPARGSLDTMLTLNVELKWYKDCDEDPLYIRAGVPSAGMVQGLHSAVYMSRTPARDTPRGYCPKYSHYRTVNHSLLVNTGISNGQDELITWRIYNKLNFSWEEGLNLVKEGVKLSVGVDKFLAVGIAQGKRQTQIFYKNNGPVGFVENGVPVVYGDHATYTLREYIRKISGIEPEVKD